PAQRTKTTFVTTPCPACERWSQNTPGPGRFASDTVASCRPVESAPSSLRSQRRPATSTISSVAGASLGSENETCSGEVTGFGPTRSIASWAPATGGGASLVGPEPIVKLSNTSPTEQV